MSKLETKQQLEQALHAFATGSLKDNALHLFATLGYESDKRLDLTPNTAETFIETFNLGGKLDPERAMLDQWQAVEFLFQLFDVLWRVNGEWHFRCDYGLDLLVPNPRKLLQ